MNIKSFAFKIVTFSTEQNLIIILFYFKDILKKLFLGNFVKMSLISQYSINVIFNYHELINSG